MTRFTEVRKAGVKTMSRSFWKTSAHLYFEHVHIKVIVQNSLVCSQQPLWSFTLYYIYVHICKTLLVDSAKGFSLIRPIYLNR